MNVEYEICELWFKFVKNYLKNDKSAEIHKKTMKNYDKHVGTDKIMCQTYHC